MDNVSSTRRPTYKLEVLGENPEDCTGLINQFILNHFVTTYDPTVDDSFRKEAIIDGQPSLVEVINSAGQGEVTALRHQWIRDADGFLVVYSITSRKSYLAVTKYIGHIHRINRPHYEMEGAVSRRIMLVGNRCDSRAIEREVSTAEAGLLAKRHGIGFVEASAKESINVERAFYDVVRELRKQRAASRLLKTGIASPPKKPKKSSQRSGLVKNIAERFSALRHGERAKTRVKATEDNSSTFGNVSFSRRG
ncbi:ras-domain-containing protein [Lophium mytilinum]|uniref:Ras-domain-containing protein n=1 Tax=Lophium mytilinum TaxID=390894 RepID=A0A6A6QX84_9PEZI|nr:ras-domain-containing protein [Lophium mytilinum]